MAEAAASAAAAALRANRYPPAFSFGPGDSTQKLNLFPASPRPSAPVTRASSLRFASTLRPSELGSIKENYDIRATRAAPLSERSPNIVRRHSSATTYRPTLGVARSGSAKGRRGSQTYLRRAQSVYAPGEPGYKELPFRLEEKHAFLPATSRFGSEIRPLPRSLRDPDALGTTRPSVPGRKFPETLRPTYLFGRARSLGRRLSQRFWGHRTSARPSIFKLPIQQVHTDIKHFGITPYGATSDYSYTEDSQYADTVVHNRIWENQSHITTLDNQGPDYFTRPPIPDTHSVATSIPIRLNVVAPTEIGTQPPAPQSGLGLFQQPTDLHGVEPRRVYSALMKSLSKRFAAENPVRPTIPEEPSPGENCPAQVSNENARPTRAVTDKAIESRRPLSEIAPRPTNTLMVEEEQPEESNIQQVTPNNAVKRIRSDDALFSQIVHPHHIWRDEDMSAENTAIAMKHLTISTGQARIDEFGSPAVMGPKVARPYYDRSIPATPDMSILGSSSGNCHLSENGQNNQLSETNECEPEDENLTLERTQTLDPVFL
ncbi:hypothetical protein ABW19_dt0210173 [Dactylella cylindrospora]|nr:hypothetical protein ABW19_dt0210173 [Dactylella cylindrospora]